MSDPLFSVKDQVVLISGGSRGIGRAIAQGFSERQATVVISSRDKESLEKTARELGSKESSIRSIVCDVTQPRAISSLVARVHEEFGRIDTLVNVAGINRRKPIVEVTEEDYDMILDVNLKGAFLMAQAAGRIMIAQGKGSQINVASLATERPLTNGSPYALSKAGMGQMTRSMALEWGGHGVRVNALAPGFILTDLTRKLWSDPGMQAWGRANTPMRRLGQPDDMVGTALFLASDASAFMTGQVLCVDGGFTAGWAWPIPAGGGQ